MTDERFGQLMNDDSEPLTSEEIKEGWHFCYEMDGLLRKEGDGIDCTCLVNQ